ncbi:hypothetical protein JW898_00340 [Candidatus Woesearchaeota archaeon]|nr:hypothetical protein [Candidatus Woesearchaeota archaeon]
MEEEVMQGEQLSGQEGVLQKEETQGPLPAKTYNTYSYETGAAHTRFLFLKTMFPLWIISHLIAMMSGYMLFSIRMYGAFSATMHLLLALGAGVFMYGMFRRESWARWYGISYSGFVVLNAWANVVISYIRYFDVIVFTDIITDVLLLLIFVIISISIYRNKEYFSKAAMFEKDSSNARRAAHIATCTILAFGLAVYFYFTWIRL